MLIDTAAIGFIVGPVAVINVTIDVDKATLSMSSVFTPFTRVLSAVTPGLLAETIAEATFPLASVYSTSLESIGRSLFARLICVVDSLGDRFAGFLLCEVLATS
jgi:hypothetical protein